MNTLRDAVNFHLLSLTVIADTTELNLYGLLYSYFRDIFPHDAVLVHHVVTYPVKIFALLHLNYIKLRKHLLHAYFNPLFSFFTLIYESSALHMSKFLEIPNIISFNLLHKITFNSGGRVLQIFICSRTLSSSHQL